MTDELNLKLSLNEDNAAKVITKGITGAIKWFAVMWLIGLAFTAAMGWFADRYGPRDSTDTAAERSGMTLRTDALTGCQYLESRTGYLTPRLDSDKMIVCNEDVLK